MFVFKPKRKALLKEKQKTQLVPLTKKEKCEILDNTGMMGAIADCFPILLVVFLVRSFLYEPFRIPSASMMPTLLRGDFILVEKFSYGIRNPFTNSVWFDTGKIERGDVVVFKYPENPSIDYIKRIVGLPGDKIYVEDEKLYIKKKDGDVVEYIGFEDVEKQPYLKFNEEYPSEHGIVFKENLMGYEHKIMHDANARILEQFYVQSNQSYGEWVVPEGHYFAMGDNREHSRDSRYWGFVPDELVVGKAKIVWFSFTFEELFRTERVGVIK
jgi:signal peptidase I